MTEASSNLPKPEDSNLTNNYLGRPERCQHVYSK